MNNDMKVLRALSRDWSLLADTSIMKERETVWTRLHDLNPIRPAVIIETELMSDFIANDELKCEDPYYRLIERRLREGIKHVTLFDDDYILANEFKVDYVALIDNSDYGVGLKYIFNHATHAVISNHPINNVSDIKNLKKRNFQIDYESSYANKKSLDQAFDGNLNVILQPAAYYLPQLSKFVFDLIGMDNMYFWLVDEPDAMAEMIDFIKNDFISKVKMYESEGILVLNNKNDIAGSGSYGYTSDLCKPTDGNVKLKDLWVWMESQETTTISPDMFEEAFLPAMAEMAKLFGMTYYGCCEQLHDRFAMIEREIKNIRSVSVSPWSNHKIMGEFLKDKYVFSKKLTPQYISMDFPDVKAQEKEIAITLSCVKNNLVEFVYRDVYEYKNDPAKFQNWIKLVRSFLR
jgi:hypothetical protein